MSGHKIFEVCISNIHIVPFKSFKCKTKNNLSIFRNNNNNNKKLQNDDAWGSMNENNRYYVHFDVAGYRQLFTSPRESPWKWNQTDTPSIIYMTHNSHEFNIKNLVVYCKLKHQWTSDDIVAQAEIDMHTIVTGPNQYELVLTKGRENSYICLVKFEMQVTQILTDVQFILNQIDITSCYNRLLPILTQHKKPTINISVGYFDPNFSQWLLLHYPMNIDSVQKNQENCIVVPRMQLNLKESILASEFLKSSIHLLFWSKEKDQEMVDYGRVVIPLLGNYDYENKNYIKIEENVLWNYKNCYEKCFHSDMDSFESIQDTVYFKIQVSNGPLFLQLSNGIYCQKSLEGSHFIGFPIPKQTAVDQDLKSVPIDEYVGKNCLSVTKLEMSGYSEIPDWFTNYHNPNPELTRKYRYNVKGLLMVEFTTDPTSKIKSKSSIKLKLEDISIANRNVILNTARRRQSIHLRSLSMPRNSVFSFQSIPAALSSPREENEDYEQEKQEKIKAELEKLNIMQCDSLKRIKSILFHIEEQSDQWKWTAKQNNINYQQYVEQETKYKYCMRWLQLSFRLELQKFFKQNQDIYDLLNPSHF